MRNHTIAPQLENLGIIDSWWVALKPIIKKLLRDCNEVVVLDPNFKGGSELINMLESSWVTFFKGVLNEDYKVVIGFSKMGELCSVSLCNGVAIRNDQYDIAIKKNNGILRING